MSLDARKDRLVARGQAWLLRIENKQSNPVTNSLDCPGLMQVKKLQIIVLGHSEHLNNMS
jgi:hypothetical protein